jgi:hypothetical protein
VFRRVRDTARPILRESELLARIPVDEVNEITVEVLKPDFDKTAAWEKVLVALQISDGQCWTEGNTRRMAAITVSVEFHSGTAG